MVIESDIREKLVKESISPQNSTQYLLQNGHDHNVALMTRDAQCTYGELHTAVNCIAHELLQTSVKPGQRVGLIGNNSIFWAASYLAILQIGAVAVPLPTLSLSSPQKTSDLIQLVECTAVCADHISRRRLQPLLSQGMPFISAEILTNQTEIKSRTNGSNFVYPLPDNNTLAALMLTSGTTSDPKLVSVSHGNIQANTDSIINYMNLTADERIMVILPFFYCFGLSLLHTHLRAGASLVISNRFAYPETVLDRMEETACTGFAGVPFTYQILLRKSTFTHRQFPALTKLQQAGGKLPLILIEELREAMPQAQLFTMYGQTEATARLSYLPPSLLDSKIDSIGRGIPGVTLTVVDENGTPVSPGVVGEIVARGDNVTLGYWRNPEATRQRFVNGALWTGDLATIDGDGYITIVDRKSDFIKQFGYRVSSQQIEEYVLTIPDVVSAAAVGVPDLESGEAIHVFAMLRHDSGLSPDDILKQCRQCMPHHMLPRRIRVVDQLPVSERGKVLKRHLREQFVS
ncbi:MAG: AMP-binding protein [Chloroflexi bacterium]|nr:AMP-binding protein [Chloroflexota bacterium]